MCDKVDASTASFVFKILEMLPCLDACGTEEEAKVEGKIDSVYNTFLLSSPKMD